MEPLQSNILVTGGTGYIGRQLVPRLVAAGHKVSLVARKTPSEFSGLQSVRLVDDLSLDSVPADIFSGADILVHLASKIRGHGNTDPAQSVSVQMSRVVADRAQAAGVPRILMLSSIAATIAEQDPAIARQYGKEKLAADRVFQDALGERVIYIRPPAVYGPGMSGPLVTLAKLLRKGVPLPLGAARAPRNYISLGNLITLLEAVAEAPQDIWRQAAGQIFMPSDATPVATHALIRMMGDVMDRPPRLFPVPLSVLRGLGRLVGKADMVSGAIDGLEYADNVPITDLFGWSPEESMPEALHFLRDA